MLGPARRSRCGSRRSVMDRGASRRPGAGTPPSTTASVCTSSRTVAAALGTRSRTPVVGRDQIGPRVALDPFLGVIGHASDEPGIHSTRPRVRAAATSTVRSSSSERRSTSADRGRRRAFSAGDCHARQADGEVSQLAIECPLERAGSRSRCATTSRCATPSRGRRTRGWPSASTRTSTRRPHSRPTRCSSSWAASTGSSGVRPWRSRSVVVDLRVTQLVNGARGIHARLAHDALR